MSRKILTILTIATMIVAIAMSGCFGAKSRAGKPTQTQAKSSEKCTSYSTAYSASKLTLPALAKKHLNQCATITDMSYIGLDPINNGNPSGFGGIVGKEDMSEWVIFNVRPQSSKNPSQGAAAFFTVFAPPRFAEQIIEFSGGQSIQIKGKYTGNRIGGYKVSTSSVTGMNLADKVFIFADEITVIDGSEG